MPAKKTIIFCQKCQKNHQSRCKTIDLLQLFHDRARCFWSRVPKTTRLELKTRLLKAEYDALTTAEIHCYEDGCDPTKLDEVCNSLKEKFDVELYIHAQKFKQG